MRGSVSVHLVAKARNHSARHSRVARLGLVPAMIDPHTAKILGGSPCVMFQIGLDMFQDLEFHQIPKSPKSDPFLVANPVVLVTKCPRFRQLSIHCLLYVLQASQPARPPTRP